MDRETKLADATPYDGEFELTIKFPFTWETLAPIATKTIYYEG